MVECDEHEGDEEVYDLADTSTETLKPSLSSPDGMTGIDRYLRQRGWKIAERGAGIEPKWRRDGVTVTQTQALEGD